ncbi:MAG: 2-oxoacid:acceptor oxidoreductase family protein [Deltaproteobacteria bacterium]|nr:2-oxoacid:acceptor oxidoreductase family protein [Deltaproteobacteria bacterium]
MANALPAPVYSRPRSFSERFDRKGGDPFSTHYCPGCGHGVVSHMIAEAIDDFGIQDRTILISPVGCAVFSYAYFDVGNVVAAHGRAPAVATGIKRARPESIVLCYQGDGDLAAIGCSEILHAANRGERISVIFINNAVYGMTGGQMAPTTLLAQRTTTTPQGRTSVEGFPLRVCELLSTLEAPAYIERVALADNRTTMKARRAIRKAIQNQIEGKGFSLVEVLSPCPTQWELAPVDACRWIQSAMMPIFPLGVYRDAERPGAALPRVSYPSEEILRVLGITEEKAPSPQREVRSDLNPRIIVSGFGGQGGLFLGEILAESAMHQGYQVSWLPSYGPEMRGGTAHCHVILSRDEVDSPLVEHPTVLLALNEPSLNRFVAKIAAGGLLIYDSSLVTMPLSRKDIEIIALPATAIADSLGDTKVANMVFLGAYLARTGLLEKSAILAALRRMVPGESLFALNLKAVEAGAEFIRTAEFCPV